MNCDLVLVSLLVLSVSSTSGRIVIVVTSYHASLFHIEAQQKLGHSDLFSPFGSHI